MFELGLKHEVEHLTNTVSAPFRARRRRRSYEMRLGRRSEDIVPALCWYDTKPELRMLVPADLVVTLGAYPVAGGWHPFDAALAEGPEALARFYAAFCPRDLCEMYFLERQGLTGEELPPYEMPWVKSSRAALPVPEKGLSLEHGVQWYGPASINKVLAEHRRLATVRESIRRNGYLPDVYGDIVGYFFKAGGEYRFFAAGAKHRAAVLAHLGHDHIPVAFRRGWPRVFDLADSAGWPGVREGRIARALCEAVFKQYFALDGRQQRERLALAEGV